MNNNFSLTDNVIDLGKLFTDILNNKRIILVVTFITFSSAAIYGFIASPVYKATALIQVEKSSGGTLAFDDFGDMFDAHSSTDTEIFILKSRSIIGQAVDELELSNVINPNYFPVLGRFIARINNWQEFNPPGWGAGYAWGGEIVRLDYFQVPEKFLMKEFTLTTMEDQSFSLSLDAEEILQGEAGKPAVNMHLGIELQLSMISARPGTEFTLKKRPRLNTIMTLQKNFKASSLGKETGIIELSLLGEDRERITSILKALSENYVKQNVNRLAQEAENSLFFLSKQIPSVRAALDESEQELNSYRAEKDSVDLSLETKSLLESIVSIEAEISSMAINETEILQRYTSKHPRYKSFKLQEKQLLAQRDMLNDKISNLPNTQQKILSLIRDFEVNQSLFLSLKNKSQELSILRASTVGNVRIIDTPVVLPKADSPKRALIILLSTVIGLLGSLFYIVTRSILSPGVSDPQDLQEAGLNVYATIPVSLIQQKFDRVKENLKKGRRNFTAPEMLLAKDHPTDLSIEAIRSLRTSLHFGMVEAKNNSIMISSGIAEVGKSFVAANLCIVLAQSGQRILIVDADLRRGYLHQRFSLAAGSGLADYLRNSSSLAEITRETGIEGLDIVTRGSIPPNPSELLMTEQFKDFIEETTKSYDIVVIDSPPVLAVTDAAIIGQCVGTTILVARFEKSTVRELEASKERFELNGIDVKGLVFNAIEARASSYYGGYNYYNYHYKSQEG